MVNHYLCTMKLFKHIFLFSILSVFVLSSCKKDKILSDSSAKLGFSTDSVLFDTVFTQVGSTTKSFRIYNSEKQTLNISKVYLGGGTNSQFRINVDGFSGTTLSDIEILAGDSLYVFVQVTVNPFSALSPLLIKDSVIFETNGNSQHVSLTAIGRDVYLHKPNVFPTNGLPPYSIIGDGTGTCHHTIWTNDKPHLIFGYAVVDSCCILEMQPGTQVYLHKYAVLWVYKDGSLQVHGTYGNEVTFEGDRLEPDYKEIPGQWGKIWLMKGSINNSFDWAKIKNGSIGIQAEEPDATGTLPFLSLKHTIIKNMTAAALYTQKAHVECSHCVFANCGQYVAALTRGGIYNFQQCTFANYWNSNPNNATGGNAGGSRTSPLFVLNNHYIDNTNTEIVYQMDSIAYFGNCIIYGELDDEMALDSAEGVPGYNLKYYFDHCMVKSASLSTTLAGHYNTVYRNIDPSFVDISINNYNLSSNSQAINHGAFLGSIDYDLNNYFSSDGLLDIGAYEYH